ncbi:MAG TPA: P1 family peptidase [Kofleriaceae bacterium]|nr:P1 family peptidase [Kofleriaceae bacterium]
MRRLRPALVLLILIGQSPARADPPRPRLRDWGIAIGSLPPGPLDAITDVPGVRVGHVTITRGVTVNTGVTAVLPHGRNLFREKVRAAVVVGNAFGKLTGALQVNELGELESPIVLTCTLCVGKAWDATAGYLLGLPGNEDVRSVNPVIGETNDGFLNDIRRRPISEAEVLRAIRGARPGPVEEGSVGAGRGTVAFGWKGGIGTASRRLEGGTTVGILVQTNFGGTLTIAGAPIGRALGAGTTSSRPGGGSIMIVLATDAPIDHRQLVRLGRRTLVGLGRAGSVMEHGSGDFVIAFTTSHRPPIADEALNPLFQAAADATEEAIVNSLLRARTVRGARGTAQALPLDRVRRLLQDHRVMPPGGAR